MTGITQALQRNNPAKTKCGLLLKEVNTPATKND